MNEKKSEIRKHFANIRNSLDKETCFEMSKSIMKQIINADYYKNSDTIFVYVSFGSEVDTLKLIDRMLEDGKRVVVPRCNKKEHLMELYEIKGRDQLFCGAYNIPEPRQDLIDKNIISMVKKDDVDLTVVPALAFDKRGMRLGYGGGYYDRFLEDYQGFSIGLAFGQCITDYLPSDEFDCMVDRVIFPEELI